MTLLCSPQRCFSRSARFGDCDEVVLISTKTGLICQLPGDLAKIAVWQPGDVEAFHKTCRGTDGSYATGAMLILEEEKCIAERICN